MYTHVQREEYTTSLLCLRGCDLAYSLEVKKESSSIGTDVSHPDTTQPNAETIMRWASFHAHFAKAFFLVEYSLSILSAAK
jgi:hypothetical protein